MIMKKEQLPNIRRVNSTGIPEAIRLLEETTEYAKKEKKHILALVTGVPGAGKTFLGLQFVYNMSSDISVCPCNQNLSVAHFFTSLYQICLAQKRADCTFSEYHFQAAYTHLSRIHAVPKAHPCL